MEPRPAPAGGKLNGREFTSIEDSGPRVGARLEVLAGERYVFGRRRSDRGCFPVLGISRFGHGIRSHDHGSVSGCHAFADTYGGATVNERLAPTDSAQIG